MAVRLGLDEDEFIFLEYEEIRCISEFYYRIPIPEKLENFIMDIVYCYVSV